MRSGSISSSARSYDHSFHSFHPPPRLPGGKKKSKKKKEDNYQQTTFMSHVSLYSQVDEVEIVKEQE